MNLGMNKKELEALDGLVVEYELRAKCDTSAQDYAAYSLLAKIQDLVSAQAEREAAKRELKAEKMDAVNRALSKLWALATLRHDEFLGLDELGALIDEVKMTERYSLMVGDRLRAAPKEGR